MRKGKEFIWILLIEWNRGQTSSLAVKRWCFFISDKETFGDAGKDRRCGILGLISYIKEEIAVIRERDPAIKSDMEVFLYPSFKAILRYCGT